MFFRDFPLSAYNFGNETDPVTFQNISTYVDIIDDIKDQIDFYQYYDLYDERPDQLSFKLYDTTDFYWTFWLMNDGIRRQGWPIRQTEIDEWIKKRYNNTVITTRNSLDNVFPVGKTVEGLTSGTIGTVYKRIEDLGQLFITGVKNFTNNELIVDENGNTVTVYSSVEEYNAVKHYLDSDEFVDINPLTGPGAQYTAVTYYDFLKEENDNLKRLRVIKPEAINSVVSAFKEALRS